MRTSQSIFTGGALASRRSADLQLAWFDAADDAHEAYLAWLDAERAARSEAFVVYQAALDREEAAARALQLHAKAQALQIR
jgi:hypothetical protein